MFTTLNKVTLPYLTLQDFQNNLPFNKSISVEILDINLYGLIVLLGTQLVCIPSIIGSEMSNPS